MVVGFCGCLLFFFVPETFWDRTPVPHKSSKGHHWTDHLGLPNILTPGRSKSHKDEVDASTSAPAPLVNEAPMPQNISGSLAKRRQKKIVGFATDDDQTSKPRISSDSQEKSSVDGKDSESSTERTGRAQPPTKIRLPSPHPHLIEDQGQTPEYVSPTEPARRQSERDDRSLAEALRKETVPNQILASTEAPPTPELRNLNSPWYVENAGSDADYFSMGNLGAAESIDGQAQQPTLPKEEGNDSEKPQPSHLRFSLQPKRSRISIVSNSARHSQIEQTNTTNSQRHSIISKDGSSGEDVEAAVASVYSQAYTDKYRSLPPKSFRQTLAPYSGRLSHSPWIRVAIRPFILYAYPAILWSALVYSLSVGWLIVLSESVTVIYRSPELYHFTALQTGLIYISPFIGGILGTVIAGKISDFIVRWMARRNGGVYEPEFRLVMAIPIAFATAIGLMGFGWSAEERDAWIVPTVFFGIVSFGCTLGSTTAITFAVDSYRQYAGEALVTLNFSKSRLFFSIPFSFPSLLILCSVPSTAASSWLLLFCTKLTAFSRYIPWPCLLSFLHRLAGVVRVEKGLPCCRRNPDRLSAVHDPNVHLRQASKNVDCPAESDGAILETILWSLVEYGHLAV